MENMTEEQREVYKQQAEQMSTALDKMVTIPLRSIVMIFDTGYKSLRIEEISNELRTFEIHPENPMFEQIDGIIADLAVLQEMYVAAKDAIFRVAEDELNEPPAEPVDGN